MTDATVTDDKPAPKKKRKGKRVTERDEDISDREEIKDRLEKVLKDVEKGFDAQNERSDQIMDNWDCYNCELSRYQNYTGNLSQIYIPIIKNGVDALVTRFVNQAFPQSGRHVEAVSEEEDEHFAILSAIEHYVEKARLRTGAARAVLRNGQLEGQYNAYVRWNKVERFVVTRETKPMSMGGGLEFPGLGQVEEVAEERFNDESPVLEILHDNDVLVLPATADSIDEALESGGSVTILRRWTKGQIEKMAEDGDITEDAADDLKEEMDSDIKNQDTEKKLARSIGIYIGRSGTFSAGYETWTKCEVDGRKRLCVARFGGNRKVLGCKLNPYWNDRCPVLSAPVKKLPGVFKGDPPVSACTGLQYQANDAINEAGHMLFYALAPIVAVDPVKVTKWKELISDVMSVWPVDPNAVKTFQWPNVVREALETVGFCKTQIFETLGANPAMLPQQTGGPGKKRNQAEIALEQQVDILTTADAVTVLEKEILSPAVQWFLDLDQQFREDDLLVREFGEFGMELSMDHIPPIQSGNRFRVVWSGVEQARNAAMIQQMISFLAMLQQVPPQQMMGFRVDAAPVYIHAAGQIFPPRLARQVLKSLKDDHSVDPEIENQMLAQGFQVLTHAQDDDPKHLQVHQQAPPSPERDAHIRRHMMAMQMKQAAMAAQGDQGNPRPGGGKMRPGAQQRGQRPGPQRPPGAIHPDRMPAAGALVSPRKT